jgi:hypothetical protein
MYTDDDRHPPNLRGNRVDTLPFHDTQNTKPELGPVRPVDGTSKLVQKASSFNHAWIILADTNQTQSNVIQRSTKNGAVTFNVKAPTTIFGVLAGKQITLDLCCIFRGDRGLGHIVSDQNTRQ